MKYICSCCGEEHEDWPALAYSSPVHYHDLAPEEKEKIGSLALIFVPSLILIKRIGSSDALLLNLQLRVFRKLFVKNLLTH